MEIISTNAETKLMPILSCIGRFPQSWRGWKAMRVAFSEMKEGEQEDAFYCAKSIVESYLSGVEGRVYNCGSSLHVICKGVPVDIMNQAGTQICELAAGDGHGDIIFTIFDLEKSGADYARQAEQDCSGAFYLVSTASFLDRMESHAVIYNALPSRTDGTLREMTKVLLIEDDPVTRWMVRNALKNECEFAAVPCAKKAFSMYSSFNPEVVFLDINLPDGDGYSVLQWIMRNDPGACVVMFSSNSNLDNILSALEKGASGFVAKPFLRENLMHYVRGTLNS